MAIGILTFGCGRRPAVRTVYVHVASSLTDVVREAADKFQAEHPTVRIEMFSAGSQEIARAIENGAPADLFCSAGPQWLDYLARKGLLRGDTRGAFAFNRLCVIVPAANPGKIASVDDLANSRIQLVLAAAAVPAGKAARTWLLRHGPDFSKRVLSNVRSEETSVRAVLRKVEMNEADAGIVFQTDAIQAGSKALSIAIPDKENVRVAYYAAVIDRSAHATEADEFRRFLAGGQVRPILMRAGFEVPKAGG